MTFYWKIEKLFFQKWLSSTPYIWFRRIETGNVEQGVLRNAFTVSITSNISLGVSTHIHCAHCQQQAWLTTPVIVLLQNIVHDAESYGKSPEAPPGTQWENKVEHAMQHANRRSRQEKNKQTAREYNVPILHWKESMAADCKPGLPKLHYLTMAEKAFGLTLVDIQSLAYRIVHNSGQRHPELAGRDW